MKHRIVESNQELFACYDDLKAGDIVLGRIRLAGDQEHLLLDLVSRGILLFPSASAQLCSRSKVYQAALLRRFMVEGTLPVYCMQDMLETVTGYGRIGVDRVVCKLDRANGGVGILRFSSIEDVFSQVALGSLAFPFVIQPFVEECSDVRVVILAETVEAYRRHNPYNFRHTLHCGGTSLPWKLTNEQLDFCRQVMKRADFPHAHVDLLMLPDGTHRLSEINLRAGLRGAQLTQQDYLQMVAEIQAKGLERMKAGDGE
jgi:ribosomal protein S6--L-glutamate ligase